MPLQKTFDVVFTDQDFNTSITAENNSLTVNDLLTQNGLMPRDGTFRYVSSQTGKMINHMSIASAPSTLRVQNPVNVVQLWIEKCRSQFAIVSSEGQKYLLFGVERDTYSNIFLVRQSFQNQGHQVRVGYSFSPLGQPYTTGKLVFLQVPSKGEQATLFNPLNGKEDYQLHLRGELQQIRGCWTVWQIGANVHTATLCAQLETIASIKTLKPRRPKANQEKASRTPSKMDPRERRVKLKSLNSISVEPAIHSAQISKNNPSRNGGAIICGVEGNSSGSNIGYVAAWGNKTRPTMINRSGYQYGMSVFVKIPDAGRVAQVYNSIQHVYVNCRLTDSPNLCVEDLRGRWVIAQLRRHTKHKRVLKLHCMPSEVESHAR